MDVTQTPYLKWQIPDENKDPHFDDLVALFHSMDDAVFGLMNTAGNVCIPAAGLSWNPFTLVLSWTGQFEIPLMSIGFSLLMPFGPDGLTKQIQLADGDRVIVTAPRTAGGNITANITKVSASPTIAAGLFTIGYCRGTSFYGNFPQTF